VTDPDAVLHRIDTELTKCICGRAIPTNGPSLDYCSLPCQNRFFAGPTASGYESHYDTGTPDGRTINEHVNHWFQESSEARPELNWSSASTTYHDELGVPRGSSPRVEFFPSPRPSEPIELAAGVDLTPFITDMEFTTRHPALLVGDHVTITDPDGHTTHSVVTTANDDGSYNLEPTEGNPQ